MRKTYDITIEGVTYQLRLGFAAQREMEKKYQENTLSTIMSCVDNLEKAADMLTRALNWDGNQNVIRDGGEFYDRLVDAGYSGQADFAGVFLGIGEASGVLKEQYAAPMSDAIKKTMDDIFSHIMDGTVIGDIEGRPTKTPEKAQSKKA